MLRALYGVGARGLSWCHGSGAVATRGIADAVRARAASSLFSSSKDGESDDDGGDAHGRAPLEGRRWPVGLDGEAIKTARARRLGITTSPQKLNLVARLARGLSVVEADRQLSCLKKKHKDEVRETIAAALTNARAFGMNPERLIVSRAYVGKGKYLKRIRPWHGKGRFGVEHKKYAHLSVELLELSDEQWEARVLRQYAHLGYRPGSGSGDTAGDGDGDGGDGDGDRRRRIARSVPDNLVKPWLVRSQLDLSLEATRARARELRAALPPKRHPFPSDWQPDAADGAARPSAS